MRRMPMGPILFRSHSPAVERIIIMLRSRLALCPRLPMIAYARLLNR
jgi:hypothetical protein